MMTCACLRVEHTAINHPSGFISVVDSPDFGTGLQIQSGHFDQYGHMYFADMDSPIYNAGQLHIDVGGKIHVSQTSPSDFLFNHYTYSDNYLIIEGELEIE